MMGGLRSTQHVRPDVGPEEADRPAEFSDQGGRTRPALTIVLAAHNADVARRWLEETQVPAMAPPVQVVLVGPGLDSRPTNSEHVAVVHVSATALTPHLWTRGIMHATGDAVALTIADCRPADDWVSAILEALNEMPSVAAIGGAIDLDPRGSPADWALYFLRYSAYMPPLQGGPVSEIAGDNAVYRRSALDRHPEAWRHGFWEPTVHASLRQGGMALALDPRIIIVHRHSLNVGEFSRQRFAHGRAFGAARFGSAPLVLRVLRALAAPAVAMVLMARVLRGVLAKRRHRLRLVAGLPFLTWFVLCWIAGETVGSFLGPPDSRSGETD